MDSIKIEQKRQYNSNDGNIRTFGELDCDAQKLLVAAVAVRKRAYCPYSKFAVGAAFRTECGSRIFSGCNVENVAFSPSCCAERTAIGKAVSEGFRRFSAGAVVAYHPDSFTSPCGMCRQVIIEFAVKDFPIYIMKDVKGSLDVPKNEPVLCTTAFNLLPYGFRAFK